MKILKNVLKSKLNIEIKKHEVDYIVGPEARGFLLGSMIAATLNVGFIPVR